MFATFSSGRNVVSSGVAEWPGGSNERIFVWPSHAIIKLEAFRCFVYCNKCCLIHVLAPFTGVSGCVNIIKNAIIKLRKTPNIFKTVADI